MQIEEIKKILQYKFNAEFIGVITYNNHNYVQCENNNQKVYYEILNNEIIQILDEAIVKNLRKKYELPKTDTIYG